MHEPVLKIPDPPIGHKPTHHSLQSLHGLPERPARLCSSSSSGSSSDCASQRTRSTVTLQFSNGTTAMSLSEMNSFDTAETDDEIVNIMKNPNPSQVQPAIVSPFPRFTTPRIANRKVLPPQEHSNNMGTIDFESASAAPSSFANSGFDQFSFALEDLSMTQFEKADSEFFAEFNTSNNGFSSGKKQVQSIAEKARAAKAAVQKLQVDKQTSKDENSLNPDDYRSLDINDIQDLVNAKNHHDQHRFHRDNNPSLHSNVSSFLDTTVKSQNYSPHSVMDLDNSTFASSKVSKPRRKKKSVGRNLNTSSFSEGESRTARETKPRRKKKSVGRNLNTSSFSSGTTRDTDTFDDDTSSFVSSKISYGLDGKTRIKVGKISDDSSSKQSSVVNNIVYSAPLARLHDLLMGDGLCCTMKGDPIMSGEACSDFERRSPRKSSRSKQYDYEDDDEDDFTYDDRTYDDGTYGDTTYDDGTLESSAYYTTDDDEDSYQHHVVKSSSYKIATPEPVPQPRASPFGRRGTSRGRSPTIRNGHSSDRSLSYGASSASSFNSDEKHVYGTELQECQSNDVTINSNVSPDVSAAAESVLSLDQASWMEMTAPSPGPSPDRSANVSMDSAQSNEKLNVSMNSTKSNFLQNLQAKTASAKVTPTKAEKVRPEIEPSVDQTPQETDGYFKKLLSVGIHLQINDPPKGSHCQKRQGKLLLCFNGQTEGKFEAPYFIWKDMNNNVSPFTAPDAAKQVESILLSDIKTIRKPREAELNGYPLATSENCFVIALFNGITLFLEAVNVVQMNRVTAGLNGIMNKLEQDISTRGDFTWIMKSLEYVKKKACDVQPHVVKQKTNTSKSLMQEAAARRKMKRRQQRS